MARYIDPVCRLCRREGEKLFLKGDRCHTPKCAIERRGDRGGPGMHGMSRRRPTEYADHLRAKQKARRIYGVLERQFQRYFEQAGRLGGARGEALLRLLELRMDSVVYRMGFAMSRSQARQLVTHGHFLLNGKRHDIPSAVLSVGDTIAVRERSRAMDVIKNALDRAEAMGRPAWLAVEPKRFAGTVAAAPEREHIEGTLNEQLIVEYYSR
ncbi:MAG: 30S ribosomal protein S4 [Actinobacteria bacterium]|nr:30S ribosomal protein S4 [Actinomycetota bacterium]